MWRINIPQIVFLVLGTRVMYWPVITLGAIEIIINPRLAGGTIHWTIAIIRFTYPDISWSHSTLTFRATLLITWQLTLPVFQSTKLPVPG